MRLNNDGYFITQSFCKALLKGGAYVSKNKDGKFRLSSYIWIYNEIPVLIPILKANPSQAMHYLISLFFSLFLLSVAAADDFDDIVSTWNKPDPVVQLTPKERAWLANHKRIRIAFDGSLPPYSFVNDSGKLEGIAIEVMNTLSKRLGIKFETYPNTTWNKLYKAAVEHKVDVVATMINRPDRKKWFIFTQPYLIKSLIIMTKSDNRKITNRADLAGKTVAMVKGNQYAGRVIEEFPSAIPYFVDSTLEGLTAVSMGKADAAITYKDTASYLQTKHLLTDLKVAAFYDHNSANESIAVRKDWPTLAVILQKALDSLSKEEMQNIYAKWVPSIKPSSDYGLISKIVATLIIVLVLMLLWIDQFRRLNRKIKLPATEVQITKESANYNFGEFIPRQVSPERSRSAQGERNQYLNKCLSYVMYVTNNILQALQSGLEHLVLKRTKAELNSSEQKYCNPVENQHNEYFLYQCDCEGIFTYISPSITYMLGYTMDEFMDHYHEYLTDNPVNLEIDERITKCTLHLPNPPYQLEIYDTKKSIHWLEVTDTPVYDEYGKCIGIDGIVHDITACKLADDRLTGISHHDESLNKKLDRNEENYTKLAESSSPTQACPRCGDSKTRRSPTRASDGILRILFYKSYRCRECRYRFWLVNPLRLVLFGGIILIIAIIVGIKSIK